MVSLIDRAVKRASYRGQGRSGTKTGAAGRRARDVSPGKVATPVDARRRVVDRKTRVIEILTEWVVFVSCLMPWGIILAWLASRFVAE
jgi:hypothetical protein